MKYNIEFERDKNMLLSEFRTKLQKINNIDTKQRLEELFKINEDKAFQQYRIELAKQIYEQDKNLFKRLSDL